MTYIFSIIILITLSIILHKLFERIDALKWDVFHLNQQLTNRINELTQKIQILETNDSTIKNNNIETNEDNKNNLETTGFEINNLEVTDIEINKLEATEVEQNDLEKSEDETPPIAPVENPIFNNIKNYFTTGNTFVKIGVVLIFLGISFLLKYAIDNNLLPIEIRLIGSALLGIGLLRFGWKVCTRSRDYGLVLQGGGIGILILTTFVSFRVYHLLSSEVAFLLLICFTLLTSRLALVQNSVQLAVFGILGGFLAPILVSSGQGQHVVLFSYYLLLNLGIVYLSWQKAWRVLNLLGFIFTFAISAAWGVLKYQPEFFSSTQPFLILFFLIYIAIPILFANKRTPELKGYVDGTLVFGNSLMTLFFQLQLVKDMEMAGAYSAVFLSAFYILLSRYLLKHKNQNFKLLAEAFISIGVVFITIAIPLAFDGLKTSAIWAVEATGIFWLSLKQEKKWGQYFSTFLIFASSVSFFLGPTKGASDYLFLNSFYISCFLIAASSYFFSYFSDRFKDQIFSEYKYISHLLFASGTLWWLLGGINEIKNYFVKITTDYSLNIELIYVAIIIYALHWLGEKYNWLKLHFLTYSFFVVLIIGYLATANHYSHPFENIGFLSWSLTLGIYIHILKKNERIIAFSSPTLFRTGHVILANILVALLAKEFYWLPEYLLGPNHLTWQLSALILPALFMIWLVMVYGHKLTWPFKEHFSFYSTAVLAPMISFVWLWLLLTNFWHSGNPHPLPFITLLNPLELTQLAALFVITFWLLYHKSKNSYFQNSNYKELGLFIGITSFLLLNGMICRFIHHYFGVDYHFWSLFRSKEVQLSFSLVWSLTGIFIMIIASKKYLRWLWLTGCGVLGAVVFKLFIVDLANINTMERIIAFIGVGLLFLVVGYYSPIPPKKQEQELT